MSKRKTAGLPSGLRAAAFAIAILVTTCGFGNCDANSRMPHTANELVSGKMITAPTAAHTPIPMPGRVTPIDMLKRKLANETSPQAHRLNMLNSVANGNDNGNGNGNGNGNPTNKKHRDVLIDPRTVGFRSGNSNLNTTKPESTVHKPDVEDVKKPSRGKSHEDTKEIGKLDDIINNQFVQIFFYIIYTTVFVLGVFGNVLVCYVVLRNRAMQTVTNIFITNLALSDILLCVLGVPFTPIYTFMGRWAFGRTLCHLVSFAQGCSIYISTLTLMSIAVDRYFVIVYPFHPRMKLSTCIAIIISIWVVAVLATIPYGMYMKLVTHEESVNARTTSMLNRTAVEDPGGNTYPPAASHNNENWQLSGIGGGDVANTYLTTDNVNSGNAVSTSAYIQLFSPITATTTTTTTTSTITATTTMNSSMITYCEEDWPSEEYRKVFGSATSILQFVLPFFIIAVCYIWVSIKLNARARSKPGSKSSRREEADRDRKKRTNRMLIAMVAVFGLSWLPINVVNIFDDFYEKSNEWRFYTIFFFIAHSIAMSSTCYNPFLYAWLNENFRKEFKHVLPCFNPSNNNNLLNIGRVYNRSERNTCGPRLRHGSDCGGHDGHDDDDDNGITQETTCLPREKLLIIPREPTYGNGSSTPLSPHNFNTNHGLNNASNSSAPDASRLHVEIALNDANVIISDGAGTGSSNRNSKRARNRRYHANNRSEDIDSGDEQTIEMQFCETPFVSSDNTTGISILETSTSTDVERGIPSTTEYRQSD